MGFVVCRTVILSGVRPRSDRTQSKAPYWRICNLYCRPINDCGFVILSEVKLHSSRTQPKDLWFYFPESLLPVDC